jgi:hypothetical protein
VQSSRARFEVNRLCLMCLSNPVIPELFARATIQRYSRFPRSYSVNTFAPVKNGCFPRFFESRAQGRAVQIPRLLISCLCEHWNFQVVAVVGIFRLRVSSDWRRNSSLAQDDNSFPNVSFATQS